MKQTLLIVLLLMVATVSAQWSPQRVDSLPLDELKPSSRNHFLLKMGEEAAGVAQEVPVIVIRGKQAQPVLGIFAAIHGNEINGIQVIRELVNGLDPMEFNGTLIAVPGLNIPALRNNQRTYPDGMDLNRIFPGKSKGNGSQQYVWQISQKLLPSLDYLIDLHTASFGRENCLYVRADFSDPKIAGLARSQLADVYLNSGGKPSAGAAASGLTMRAQAMSMGIPAITVEYGNPQVYQKEMLQKGLPGLRNTLVHLGMLQGEGQPVPEPVFCKKSYWMYTTQGGYLDVQVDLKEKVSKGQVIAVLRDPFGQTKQTYYSPEYGIVIGRSSNPINESGGRIIHLGILD